MDTQEKSELTVQEPEGVYQTQYQKPLVNYLRGEALPNEANYRSLQSIEQGKGRPTLDYLHDENTLNGSAQKRGSTYGESQNGAVGHHDEKVVKLGWLGGVMMPVVLNIFGAILFLRLSWVVGEAGIIYGILIIILAHCITFITALSMSAIATNGEIKGGGAYYMISRDLGPQFGGSIGLTITIANAIAVATYIIGFVNYVQDMCVEYGSLHEIIPGTGGGTNDVRILGTITLLVLLVPAIVGMEWVNRVEKLLLIILVTSQVNFLVGSFMGPQNDLEVAEGFVGFHSSVMTENLKTDWRFFETAQSFFTVFGVFFPSVTDIVVGANLSGDLKDPSSAIPKGTVLAIMITFVGYIIYPILIGAAVVRHATGNVTQYLLYNEEGLDPLSNPAFNISTCGVYATGQAKCKFGLQNSVQVMGLMSAWAPHIYIGCFAAALSSGLSCLVAAPRVLQALAKDKLYPFIHVFAKGVGVNSNPIRGYGVVSIIALACILIGELNLVSSLLTNCFLASYAFINFSCFHASVVKTPGWRPSFKYYNLWLSLSGGILCVVVMFFIDHATALITFLIAIFLYLYVSYRKPDVNWGSSTQAQTHNFALKTTLELLSVEDHVKNYRPEILLLSGSPSTRPTLVDFASTITRHSNLLTCANITKESINIDVRNYIIKRTYKWFADHKIKSFYTLLEAPSLREGTKIQFQMAGLGKLRPNILMVGYKTNWKDSDPEDLKGYFHILHDALSMHFGLTILRVQRGFDVSNEIMDEILPNEFAVENGWPKVPPTDKKEDKEAKDNIKKQDATDITSTPTETTGMELTDVKKMKTIKKGKSEKTHNLFLGTDGKELPQNLFNEITIFRGKQKGTIDVWWLYDDGGLTVLLPYILSKRSHWSSCKVRLFALANKKDELELEQRSMINLLNKFRIDFNDLKILSDVNAKASDGVIEEFNEILKNFKADNFTSKNKNHDLMLSENELTRNHEKTNRNLRIRELLYENSKDASLIVMTLPIPGRNSVSASLYMAWLEILSKDMPPFLFIRGNQTSVLTYYS